MKKLKLKYCDIKKIKDKNKFKLLNLIVEDLQKDFPHIKPDGIYLAQPVSKNIYEILKKYFTIILTFNINKKVFVKKLSFIFALYYTLYSFKYKKFLIYKIIMGKKMLRKLIYYFDKNVIKEEHNYIPINFYIVKVRKHKNIDTSKIIIKEYNAKINEKIEKILRNNKNTIDDNFKKRKKLS